MSWGAVCVDSPYSCFSFWCLASVQESFSSFAGKRSSKVWDKPFFSWHTGCFLNDTCVHLWFCCCYLTINARGVFMYGFRWWQFRKKLKFLHILKMKKRGNTLLIKESLLDLAQPIWLMPALKGKANCLHHLSLRGLIADIRSQQGVHAFLQLPLWYSRKPEKERRVPAFQRYGIHKTNIGERTPSSLTLWDTEDDCLDFRRSEFRNLCHMESIVNWWKMLLRCICVS